MEIDNILDHITAALGGFQRLRDLHRVYYEGIIEIGTLKGSVAHTAETRLFRTYEIVELQIGQNIAGYDGRVLWTKDTHGRVSVRDDPEELAKHLVQNQFTFWHYLINREAYNFTLIDAGGEYQLRIDELLHNPAPFASMTIFVDKTSYRITKEDRCPQGVRKIVSYQRYKEIDGLNDPIESSTFDGKNHLNVKLTKLILNQPIDDERFSVPRQTDKSYLFLNGLTSTSIPLKRWKLCVQRCPGKIRRDRYRNLC